MRILLIILILLLVCGGGVGYSRYNWLDTQGMGPGIGGVVVILILAWFVMFVL